MITVTAEWILKAGGGKLFTRVKMCRIEKSNPIVSKGQNPERPGNYRIKDLVSYIVPELVDMLLRHYQGSKENPDFAYRHLVLRFIVFKIIRFRPLVFILIQRKKTGY
jgi:hypothetical protein